MKDYAGIEIEEGDKVVVCRHEVDSVKQVLMNGVVSQVTTTPYEFLGKWGDHESVRIVFEDGKSYLYTKHDNKKIMVVKKGNE